MLLKVHRIRFTWLFTIANFKSKEIYDIYFQFSLKDPWLLPKYDPHFGKTDTPLYGWLFFYFGRQTIGMLYKTDATNAPICDKKGNKYTPLYAENRNKRDALHALIKNNMQFKIGAEIAMDEHIGKITFIKPKEIK